MNIGALIVLFKLIQDSGAVSPGKPFRPFGEPRPPATPPSGEQGVRPACGSREKAVFFQNPDRWVCVPKFN